MEKNRILFGIVCFREKYWETSSFLHLIKSYKSYARASQELNIYIYDNTNVADWSVGYPNTMDDSIQIHYHHDPLNSGISAAFNHFADFAQKNSFEWIVFLDQDSKLPINFYEKYDLKSQSENSLELAFPKVYSNNQLMSPSKYYFYRTQPLNLHNEHKIELRNITGINSGLMIRTKFFLDLGGYNRRLRIDFCDHEFMERINHKKIFAELLDVRLEQNFSADTDVKTKSLIRYQLYVNDMKVFRENKNKLLFFFRVDLPHLFKEMYKHKSLEFLKIRIGIN